MMNTDLMSIHVSDAFTNAPVSVQSCRRVTDRVNNTYV